jgi:predicted transcriptional regulator
MTVRISVPLEGDQKARLDALAAARQETAADIVVEAVAQYLEYDSAFRRAVEEGLTAARRGDVSDFEPFADELRRRMAVRIAETDA